MQEYNYYISIIYLIYDTDRENVLCLQVYEHHVMVYGDRLFMWT